MNNRIKKLRQTLGLSGEKFGAKIGLKRSSISHIENGKYSVTQQTIIAIVREYNVNEEWLQTRQGSMFNSLKDSLFADLLDKYQLDSLDVALIKNILNLSTKEKQIISELINLLV